VELPVTFGKYIASRTIGRGSTCVVVEAIHRETGQRYAVKIINTDPQSPANLNKAVEREISVLQRLDHPNIVRLFNVVRTQGRIFVAPEHCEGGILLDLLRGDRL
jgi:serine/threonine protein kinase